MVNRGSFITSAESISKGTGVPRGTVERILKYLKSEVMIEEQTTRKFRLISVINYNKYQSSEEQNEEQVRNKRGTSEEQVDTNKNDKNDNNEKNDNNIVASDDFIFQTLKNKKNKTTKDWTNIRRLEKGLPMLTSKMTDSQKRVFNEMLKIEEDIQLYRRLAREQGFDYLELPEDANAKIRRQMLACKAKFKTKTPEFYKWVFSGKDPWPLTTNFDPEACITAIMFRKFQNKDNTGKDSGILEFES
jgi:hypothetical protein